MCKEDQQTSRDLLAGWDRDPRGMIIPGLYFFSFLAILATVMPLSLSKIFFFISGVSLSLAALSRAGRALISGLVRKPSRLLSSWPNSLSAAADFILSPGMLAMALRNSSL